MQASSDRTGQVRLALMLIVGVAAAVACVVTLMWLKAPVAPAQEEGPTGESFVVSCGFTGIDNRRAVDPIVAPGPSGTNPDGTPVTPSPHAHDFFGNTTTNSDSTYNTLRAGGTTCSKLEDKAAYWIPTVSWTDSSGTTVRDATQTFFYYKLGGKGVNTTVNPQPALDTDGDGQLDNGLKIITLQGKNVEWRCANGTWSTTPPRQCSNGKLVVRIKFPDCLAVNSSGQPLLDSPDHRSHMVDSVKPNNSAVDKCPSTHPYPVPMLQTNFTYPIPTTRGTVKLSSDMPGASPGSTMHADFYNAWDQAKLKDLVDRCINAAPFTSENPKPADCA